MQDTLLEVNGLETQFKTPEGMVHAVNGISFSLKNGETIGLVGESGSGKSVTMLSVLQLIPSPPGKIVAGSAMFNGKDLLHMNEEQIRHIRGSKISIVFQDPMTSFNAVLTIGKQITEAMVEHMGMTEAQARKRAGELLDMVGIPQAKKRLDDYPHQFSGGMRQRAMIAMALACRPQILIADEPTTSLDVTIQAQIVELVKNLRDEFGMAVIWITHDLGIIAGLAQRVFVMYGGYFIEEAPVYELYENPRHPYTIGLLGSLPRMDMEKRKELSAIDGMPPVLFSKPNYCPFAPRCHDAIDRCRQENPPLETLDGDHKVACWVKPKVGKVAIGYK